MAKITDILKVLILFLLVGTVASCTKWNYHDGGLSYGVHECSMWEYLHKQPFDWDSTIIMIEHAGLKELFEGKGEHQQITFLGITNISIQNYMFQNEYEKVTDIPKEVCRNILCKLIIPKRLMVSDIPRGNREVSTGKESGGIELDGLSGSMFIWTYQEPYMYVEEVGEISLNFITRGGKMINRVYSTDIQTNNGVVQALGYSFVLTNI